MAETLSSSLIAAKNARLDPEPMIWLVTLDASALGGGPADASVDGVLREWIGAGEIRLALHDDDITFNGEKYRAFPGRMGEQRTSNGTLLNQVISIGVVDRRLTYMLEQGGIVDQEVTATRITLGSLADASHGQTFRYVCTSVVVADQGANVNLESPILSGQLLPKYRFIRYRCRFTFKDTDTCGYVGAESTCDKTYDLTTGCKGRNNQANYGGYPDLLTGSADPWL